MRGFKGQQGGEKRETEMERKDRLDIDKSIEYTRVEEGKFEEKSSMSVKPRRAFPYRLNCSVFQKQIQPIPNPLH